mmetsp:Transcript_15460/g.23164  ORF Transcript_15460/g.23164 Transcript_15460/m.23164 type:complete len:128 (+) Transcript_15460:72-455(+)
MANLFMLMRNVRNSHLIVSDRNMHQCLAMKLIIKMKVIGTVRENWSYQMKFPSRWLGGHLFVLYKSDVFLEVFNGDSKYFQHDFRVDCNVAIQCIQCSINAERNLFLEVVSDNLGNIFREVFHNFVQ